MTSNKLASARSIFEQNIQKNREAGCDRNILGQRTNCSRKVTRRLFAHTKLSDDSSSKGSDEQQQPQSRRRSSISSQTSDASSVVAAIRRRSSQSSSRQQSPASSSCQDDQQQAKGQTTTEQRRTSSTELKSQEEETQKVAFPPPASTQEKISLPFQNFKQHQQQKEKKRGSISSLADHLSKLELQNMKNRPRGDADSIVSQSSLETHRDQIRLPDFRQSSYVRSGVGGACSGSNRPRRSSRRQQVSSKSIQSSNGSNDSSNKPSYNRPMTDESSSNSSRRTTGDRSPRTPPTANRRLSTSSRSSIHPSQSDNNNMSSPNSWIRPSAVVLEEDASEHQNRPFRSVPFTKSTIKRHRDGGKSTTLSPKTSRRGSVSMNDNSQSSLNSTDSTASRRMEHGDKSRRRSSMGACGTRRRSKPDPQELALQEEMEALQKQIAASKAKLVQVQQGERYDLKRVEETKQRKLKRVDTTERKSNNRGNNIQLTAAEEKFLSDKYKSVKQTIRQFKQDNAKIHNDNRKQKLDIWSIQADNRLSQESLTEVQLFVQERQAQQQQQLQEQDQLMQLAATLQKAILDTEEAIELKNPEKVKGERMQLEDRIDMLVDFMQKQCSDFALVEELTIMAFDDDEEGWDDGSVDDDDAAIDASSAVIQTPYHRNIRKDAVDSDDESPRSVTDLIIPTSSHSLHIFL